MSLNTHLAPLDLFDAFPLNTLDQRREHEPLVKA